MDIIDTEIDKNQEVSMKYKYKTVRTDDSLSFSVQ